MNVTPAKYLFVFHCAVVVGVAQRVSAWESQCYEPNGAECPPPGSAELSDRMWENGRDEHRTLFDAAMRGAGVPSYLLGPTLLYIPFDDLGPGVKPESLHLAKTLKLVSKAPAEFSQLPDYGYTMGDWATAFHGCPPDPSTDGARCHEYKFHLGPLNASHFAPQNREFYQYYHEIALELAARCKRVREQITGAVDGAGFDEIWQECEFLAMSYEALSQHYLQDAWSVGHMWERWGAAERSAFPFWPIDAVVVAAVAGLIHGSQATTTFPDAMCSPTPGVQFRLNEGEPVPGIGDFWSSELETNRAYRAQSDGLRECSVGSIDDILHAFGYSNTAATWQEPEVARCFSGRATNAAMWIGLTLDPLALTATALASRLDQLDSLGVTSLPEELRALHLKLTVAASFRPDATDMASGGIGSFLGIGPNGKYLARGGAPAFYLDAGPPWPSEVSGATTSGVAALARIFHRANATTWCSSVDAITLAELGRRATRSEGRELCVEFVRRHIRIADDYRGGGCGESPRPKSLCEILGVTGAATLDIARSAAESIGTDARQLGAAWCEGRVRSWDGTQSDSSCGESAPPASNGGSSTDTASMNVRCVFHDYNVDPGDRCPALTDIDDKDAPPSRCWHCRSWGNCVGIEEQCCSLERVAAGKCQYDSAYAGSDAIDPCVFCPPDESPTALPESGVRDLTETQVATLCQSLTENRYDPGLEDSVCTYEALVLTADDPDAVECQRVKTRCIKNDGFGGRSSYHQELCRDYYFNGAGRTCSASVASVTACDNARAAQFAANIVHLSCADSPAASDLGQIEGPSPGACQDLPENCGPSPSPSWSKTW